MTDAPVPLHVNGQSHAVTADGQTPLLYVLRNDLGLTATRFGCGQAQCGACHVLIEGRSVPACDTPLWACENKHITTLEGLGQEGELHPLQQAFVEEQAIQCGYCVSGIMITAKALLDQVPNPTESQILTALEGHLCRCGTHWRFVRAIQRAAQRMQEVTR
jgi:nicotinate dehydrogenase subunit A